MIAMVKKHTLLSMKAIPEYPSSQEEESEYQMSIKSLKEIKEANEGDCEWPSHAVKSGESLENYDLNLKATQAAQ